MPLHFALIDEADSLLSRVQAQLRALDEAETLNAQMDEKAQKNVEAAEAILNEAGGFLRSQLARVLKTRTTPKLRLDETFAAAERPLENY